MAMAIGTGGSEDRFKDDTSGYLPGNSSESESETIWHVICDGICIIIMDMM